MEALTVTPNLELPAAELERLYADMVRIRSFEERVVELFQAGLVKGTAHSYAGEEAIAVGACAHSAERTTTSRAIIAATATASPRGRRPIA